MEHVVFFPAPDGAPAFRRVPSLDEAVRFVEHLRNVEGVAEVSVYSLSEVPVAFRPYYRVEVPVQATEDTVADGLGWPEPVPAVAEEPVEELVPVEAVVAEAVAAETLVPVARAAEEDEPVPAVGFFTH